MAASDKTAAPESAPATQPEPQETALRFVNAIADQPVELRVAFYRAYSAPGLPLGRSRGEWLALWDQFINQVA